MNVNEECELDVPPIGEERLRYKPRYTNHQMHTMNDSPSLSNSQSDIALVLVSKIRFHILSTLLSKTENS